MAKRESSGTPAPGVGSGALRGGGVSFSLVLVALIAVVLFLSLAGALMYRSVYQDRIYLGVNTLGLDLGSYTKEEARALLTARVEAYLRSPLLLRYSGQEWKTTPGDLGVRYDIDGTIAAAFRVGREGNPLLQLVEQIKAFRQGQTIAKPSFSLDEAKLRAHLGLLSLQIDQPVRDARLVLQPDLRLQTISSQGGRKLDEEKTTQLLKQAFTSLSSVPVRLIVEETPPTVMEADLADARAMAEKMLSAPLVLRFGERTWTLEPKDIGRLMTFQEQSGEGKPTLNVVLDYIGLKELVQNIAKELDSKPINARLNFSQGKLQVIRRGIAGRQLNVRDAIEAIKSQVASDERTVELPVQVLLPAFSAKGKEVGDYLTGEEAATLGIKEIIEEASTPYAGSSPPRKHNVEMAVSRLHGVLVAPGEVFSFNEELGPTTLKSGYQIGWGIITSGDNVETVPSVAGGICQVATTLFQPIFWAGYQIEERRWHIYWIPRYISRGLKGLDATVDEEANLDLKFKNTTSTYILIQGETDGQNVRFALYGTKPTWKVEVAEPQITNVVKADPTEVKQEDPTAPEGWSLLIEHAEDGFDIVVVRTVTDGADVRTLTLKSSYRPSRNVLMVGTKKPEG